MVFRESPQILCGSCSESVVVDEFDIFILVHAVQACWVLQIFIERLEITGITDFGEVKHRVVIAADVEMVAVCEQVTCAGFFLSKTEFIFGTFGCVSDDRCPVPGPVFFRITAVYGESLFVIDACCGICLACAWEFVEKLPDTINSALGERGRGLSEGQAQRISIARAVLRNAPILLLDEATSALDVTTERKVLRNIIEQKPNKTCIVTTHRPSVLNMCQRVYRVMETKVTELDEEESSRMAMDF